MRILVTGAAGFIGAALCHRLLQQGHAVTGLDNINDYYDTALKYSRLAGLGIEREDAGKWGEYVSAGDGRDFYNPQNETCNAPRTKGAKIKTKREARTKRSVPSVRFHIMPGLSHFKKIFARLRRGLRVDPGACPSLLSPAPLHYI